VVGALPRKGNRYVRYQTDLRPSARHRGTSAPHRRTSPISSPKPIQIILARQFASSLATPILIVDTQGTLIYYNEPAEAILGQRFEETGEIAADTWSKLFAIEDEERNAIPQESRPTMLALSERKPFSRTVWMQCGHREWRHVNITAYPLIGEAEQFLGAKMIFWEV
jgi:PAS domain-containing protein